MGESVPGPFNAATSPSSLSNRSFTCERGEAFVMCGLVCAGADSFALGQTWRWGGHGNCCSHKICCWSALRGLDRRMHITS